MNRSARPASASCCFKALGREARAHGVGVLLGPGVNIKRHPLCGRNFEYFSEDPLLAGELGAAWISGVQSNGVGASLKHFAANNQEQRRMIVDTCVDERTLREIYLVPFELAVHKGQPWTVMCAYNRLNGFYCSENNWLLNTLLRDEWRYDGLVVTDWGAVNDRCLGVRSGLDLEMPSSAGYNDRKVEAAVKSGKLPLAALETSVVRTVALILAAIDTKRVEASATEAGAEEQGEASPSDGTLSGAPSAASTSDISLEVAVLPPKRGSRGKLKPPGISPARPTRPTRPSVPLHEADAAASPGVRQPSPAARRGLNRREDKAEQEAQERRRAERLQTILDEHHLLAQRAALESAVLLKNAPVAASGADEGAPQRPLLPLPENTSVAVVGGFAETPRFQGAGSSKVNAHRVEVPIDCLRAALAQRGCQLSYSQGFEPDFAELSTQLVDDAVQAATRADMAIILAGLPDTYESEGFDRTNMRLPPQIDTLIAAVAQAQPRVVLVLFNGAPVEMPWLGCVPALLEMYLPGQAGGLALADLLTGRACPSGKLAETFPTCTTTCASHPFFGNHPQQLVYREGLNVGYRHFATHEVATLFPFGHGLSYTHFTYSKLKLARTRLRCDEYVEFSFEVTNGGGCEGAEVVQIYVHDVESSVFRPKLELRDFGKVHLKPGETSRLCFTLGPRAFAFWETLRGDFYVEPGTFEVLVGASSADIRLSAKVEMEGPRRERVGGQAAPAVYTHLSDDDLEALGIYVPSPDLPLPFHTNSAVGDIAEEAGLLGRVFWKLLEAGMGEVPDRTEQMLRVEMVRSLPLQALMRFANGSAGRIVWPEPLLHLMVWIFNVASRWSGSREKRMRRRLSQSRKSGVRQPALRAPLTAEETSPVRTHVREMPRSVTQQVDTGCPQGYPHSSTS